MSSTWQSSAAGRWCVQDAYEALVIPAAQPGIWLARVRGPRSFWQANALFSQERAEGWCEQVLRAALASQPAPSGPALPSLSASLDS